MITVAKIASVRATFGPLVNEIIATPKELVLNSLDYFRPIRIENGKHVYEQRQLRAESHS